ncbi:MAG TPA: DUF2680 domain-containing protein [Clostridia bacterium]|nr:DUF2680 domain-containing protein [Clostridia bacterium]
MKTIKGLAVIGVAVLVLLAGAVTAFAALQQSTPAELVAELTGRDLQSIIDEGAETGKTYGSIAKEAGVLEEFKKERVETKKDILDSRVAEGILTQEEADTIMNRISANQAYCDGTGNGCGQGGAGCGIGAGFGQGNGNGHGNGHGHHGHHGHQLRGSGLE